MLARAGRQALTFRAPGPPLGIKITDFKGCLPPGGVLTQRGWGLLLAKSAWVYLFIFETTSLDPLMN